MEELSFSPFVPDGVVILARHLVDSHFADRSFFECCERLQRSGMDDVWKLFLEAEPVEGAGFFLKKVLWPEIELYGLSKMDISQQACAAIFYYCVKARREFGPVKSRTQRDADIKHYIIANDVLRELIDDRSANDPRFEPGLCESLEKASLFVVQRFRDLLYDYHPASIQNNGESAPLRHAMRKIGYITTNVYGEAKYDLLAVIGSNLFDGKESLTDQKIKTWFKGLQLSSATAKPRRGRRKSRKKRSSTTIEE